MKILVLAPQPFFQERGTPIAVKLLLETLAEEGHKIDVLTYHEGQDVNLPGVNIHRIANIPGVHNIRPGFSWKKLVSDAFMSAKAMHMAIESSYDVVHAVEEAAFIAWGLSALFHLPYIYDMDSSMSQQVLDKFPWLKRLARFMSKAEGKAVHNSHGVLTMCHSLRSYAKGYAPHGPVACLEDISLLHDGQGENAAEVAAVEGLKVMYVGNLESYQGIDLLLQGFKLAVAQADELRLVVIGGSDDDIAKYRAQAEKLGLEQSVSFLGPRPADDLGLYLSAADILVSPRVAGENTPMKIYSYMDSGKPILATRLKTHTQVLDDNVAFLVAPQPEDLARGLLALAASPQLRHDLAQKSKRKVRLRYSREAYRRKLTGFYKAVERSLRKKQPTMAKPGR